MYTVSAGQNGPTGDLELIYPRFIDQDTLTVCENYARSWCMAGDNRWADIFNDQGEVIQRHRTPTRERDIWFCNTAFDECW
jgi:hypothetical protein